MAMGTGLGLNRIALRAIAQAKLDDARLLLQHGRVSNAYYLAGYAAEIALKACIAKQIIRETIPDKKFIADIHVHDLKKLLLLSGLGAKMKADTAANSVLGTNWALVAEWSPEVRYEAVDLYTAQIMLAALDDTSDGVFQWIKQHW